VLESVLANFTRNGHSILQCDAGCCSVLQCVAACTGKFYNSWPQCVAVCAVYVAVFFVSTSCSVLQCVMADFTGNGHNMLQGVAVCVAVCIAVCVTVCCRILQCVVLCCKVYQQISKEMATVCCRVCCSVCCSVLRFVAVCCSVLQGVPANLTRNGHSVL